jgi:HEPN domain-containing protein
LSNVTLARAYFKKAVVRLEVLDLLMQHKAYSDVVREAQEAVELALKGMLRSVGIEPPKYHDVGGLLLQHADKFIPEVSAALVELATISKRLRKERELAFYGDIDFIPTEEYDEEDAESARRGARRVVEVARLLVTDSDRP